MKNLFSGLISVLFLFLVVTCTAQNAPLVQVVGTNAESYPSISPQEAYNILTASRKVNGVNVWSKMSIRDLKMFFGMKAQIVSGTLPTSGNTAYKNTLVSDNYGLSLIDTSGVKVQLLPKDDLTAYLTKSQFVTDSVNFATNSDIAFLQSQLAASLVAIGQKASTTDLSNLNLQLRSDLATKSALIDSIKSFVVAFHYAGFTPNSPISVDYSGMKNGWHAIHFSNTAYGVTYDANSQATVPVVSSYYDATTNTYTNAGFSTTSIRDNNILMAKVENGAMVAWYTIAPNSRLAVEVAALKTLMGSKASSVDLSAEAAARVQMVSDSNNLLKVTQFAYPYYRMKDSLLPVIARTIQHTSNVLIYVDTLGNDFNDGLTRASAVLTVDRAMDLINLRSGVGTWAYIYIYSSATNPVLFGTKYSSLQRNTYVIGGNTGATIKLINSQAEITGDKILFSTHATLLWRCNTVFDTARVTGFGLGVNGKMIFIIQEMKFTKAGQILVQGAGSAFHNHSNEVSFEYYNINTQGISPIYFSKPMNNGNGLYNHNYKLDVNIKGSTNPALSLDMRYVNSIYYSANGLWTSEAISPNNDTYTKFVSKQSWEKPIDYTNNNAANYNIRSMTDKGYVDSVSRVKSKTLTLPNNLDFSIDLESGIQVTTLLSFTSGNIVTPPTINATFSNIRDGGIYRIRLTGTYNTGYIVFPSNVYKKDGTQFGTYTCLPETLIFHAEGTNLICDNK